MVTLTKIWMSFTLRNIRQAVILNCMYLHKTAGVAGGTVAGKPEPSVQTAASKSPQPQAAKPSASAPPAVPRSASALVAAAGLPMDKLSASIVSFARFFSLPLKPEMMAAVRRQALASSPTAQVDTAKSAATVTAPTETAADTGAKNREALSLAAAAAEGKGIELNPKGLEAFAEAIDPDWQKRQDPEGRNQRGRRHKNHHEREGENAPSKTGPVTAAGVAEMALETVEKNPLLAILNRLPGKNGQRWVVLPFSFCEHDREFRVSLRILLETDNQALNRAVRMALDIVESGKTENAETERRWLFVLESANGPAGKRPVNRLTVYLQDELSPRACSSLARELSALMEIPPGRISVKTRTESFPCESGCGDDLLRGINEAV